MPVSPGTIGQLLEEGFSLTAHCGCGHSRKIDLDGLAGQLGPQRSYLNGSICFRCSCCSALTTQITVSGPGAARGHY